MESRQKVIATGVVALAMTVVPAAFAGAMQHHTAAAGASAKTATVAPVTGKATKVNKKTHARWLTHAQVMTVQNALIAKGYALKADGRWGKQTTEAVKDFQKKNGLAQTGHPGPKTRKALGITL